MHAKLTLMKNSISAILLAATSLLTGVPVHAESDKLSEGDQAAIQQAVNRGDMIFAYDQAAWHATDEMIAAAEKAGRTNELVAQGGGWIVRPNSASNLEVLFFDKNPDKPRMLFSAEMSHNGRKVLASAFRDANAPALDDVALRMIKARRAAMHAAEQAKPIYCAKAAPNMVVLPPEGVDGTTTVYLLTPQTEFSKVPFGGHTRILVRPDGTVSDIHPFTKSCIDVPSSEAKDKPEANVVTQIVDPLPSEIAVFTMFASGIPLYVATADHRLWSVTAPDGNAKITLLPVKN